MSKGLRAIWRDTRDAVSVWGGGVLLFVIALVAALQFVGPPPPDRIAIATGAEGGAYRHYGELLAARLAREGIEVELRETAGSVENLALLESDDSVDLGFVQGGLAASHPIENIVSLGSLYLEPLWMFAGTDIRVDSGSHLDGKRIAVGAVGSGTRAVATQLLELGGIGKDNAVLLDTEPGDLAAGFSSGEIDVAFLVGAPDSEHVARLVQMQGVDLVNMERADALVRYSPYFSKITLPEGVLDLRKNLPSTDTSTVAVTAMLAASQDLHPAITDLLLIASAEVFGGHSLLADAGQFPTERYTDLPLSKEAKRFYKYGPPFLMRYLPFWAATLVDRLWVVLLPFIGLAIPLGKVLPPAHRWRIRRRLLRRYALLDTIDPFGNPVVDSDDLKQRLSKLEKLDAESAAEIVPRSYMDDVYKLRRDIDLVRRRLMENQQSGEANNDTN
jgi:TRAP transporter TAXI family solute receptor